MRTHHYLLFLPTLFLTAATTPSTTQPATQPTTIPTTQPTQQEHLRRFTSMPDILNKVPDNLRPQATYDWHKYTENKFKEWVTQQMIGMSFDEEIQFGGASAHQNLIHYQPGAEWMIPASGYSHRFSCLGTMHTWSVGIPAIYTDEPGARKWESYKPGTRMRLKGTIKSVSMSPHTLESNPLPQYDFGIILADPELIPPK